MKIGLVAWFNDPDGMSERSAASVSFATGRNPSLIASVSSFDSSSRRRIVDVTL
jgi:hypothetical protein